MKKFSSYGKEETKEVISNGRYSELRTLFEKFGDAYLDYRSNRDTKSESHMELLMHEIQEFVINCALDNIDDYEFRDDNISEE